MRSKVGSGYLLTGRVLSAIDCEPLRQARIEVWVVAPNARYDDEHRATLPPVASDGGYRFESNRPVGYSRTGEEVPPHIHLRVSAPDHEALRVEHYSSEGVSQARFDLVLTR